MANKEQKRNFLDTITPIVMNTCLIRKNKGEHWVLPSVSIAMAACESAWGTTSRMIEANAIFGIKVGKNKVHFGTAWKDDYYITKTKECYDNKTYTEIVDSFRKYSSLSDSVEDFYDMITSCSRYRAACNQTDALKTITAIKKGGYSTSPTYIATIMSIINSNNLYKYDYIITGIIARKTLKLGSINDDVLYLQQALTQLGYFLGEIDGIFGKLTLKAVTLFQLHHNLTTDGIVGKKTWERIESLL